MHQRIVRRDEGGARLLAALQYEPFPDVSGAIPELASDLGNVVRLKRP